MTLNEQLPQVTTPGTGHPRLHFVQGGHLYAGESVAAPIRLQQAVTLFGSDPEADVILEGLAPRHAEVCLDEHDEYVVHALDGPVLVNGTERSQAQLHTGDRVTLNAWTVTFTRDEATDHVVQPHYAEMDSPHGLLERWEWLLYRIMGPANLGRRKARHHRD